MKKNIRIFSSLFLALSMFLASGCGKDVEQEFIADGTGTNTGESTNDGGSLQGTDIFTQGQPELVVNELDVLFVVDTSGSLIEERSAISDGIEKMLRALPDGLNFNLGVLLSHIEGRSGKLYQASSEPYVLSSSSMTISEIADDFVLKMESQPEENLSDGGEAGFISLSRSLNGSEFSDNQSKGFFGEDAGLAVVFVSDENDLCSRYLNIEFVPDPQRREIPAYDRFCVDAEERPILTHIQMLEELQSQTEDRPLITEGLLYSGDNPVPDYGENEIGYGYKELIELNGGSIVDLADPAPDPSPFVPDADRIADGLKTIGENVTSQVFTVQTSFVLTKDRVVASSIRVFVDGEEVMYTYDPDTLEVTLTDAGGPGSTIRISYRYQVEA